MDSLASATIGFQAVIGALFGILAVRFWRIEDGPASKALAVLFTIWTMTALLNIGMVAVRLLALPAEVVLATRLSGLGFSALIVASQIYVISRLEH